jgi:HlyD family secretion protein
MLLIAVLLSVIFTGRTDEKVEGYGIVDSENVSLLTSTVNGVLSDIYIEEGDFVQKGASIAKIREQDLEMQLEKSLARLKDGDLELKESWTRYHLKRDGYKNQEINILKEKILKLKLNSELKRKDLEMKKELFSKKLLSLKDLNEAEINYEIALSEERASKEELKLYFDKQTIEETQLKNEYEQAKNRYLLAKKEFEDAKKKLCEATIKSPLDGIILTLEKKEGELLLEGQRLGSIAPLNEVKFIANIPEDRIQLVKENLETNIYLDAFPFRKFKIFKGKVYRIFPIANVSNSGAAFKVVIQINNPFVDFSEGGRESRTFLKPGLSGKAEIIIRKDISLAALIIDRLLKKH